MLSTRLSVRRLFCLLLVGVFVSPAPALGYELKWTSGKLVKWAQNHTYYSNDDIYPFAPSGFDASYAAAAAWNAVPTSSWAFYHDESTGDLLRWTVGKANLGASEGVGVTFMNYSPSTGSIASSRTLLNSYFPLSTTGVNSAYDVQNVMTHEFGHWLFLGDRYDNEYVTMYGIVIPGEERKRSLSSDEVNGLAYIY